MKKTPSSNMLKQKRKRTNKQADFLHKATTLLSYIFIIHRSIPFKNLLLTFAVQLGTQGPKSRSKLIDYYRTEQNRTEQNLFRMNIHKITSRVVHVCKIQIKHSPFY